MSELIATAAEARANFAKIASSVSASGRPVTILKNSKPWVMIAPVGENSPIVAPDWSKLDVVPIDPGLGYAALPSEWDDPDDDGLYDDLVK